MSVEMTVLYTYTVNHLNEAPDQSELPLTAIVYIIILMS